MTETNRRRPVDEADGVGKSSSGMEDASRPNSDTPPRRGRGCELLESLRRRHESAKRLPPLPHSRHRDPLTPRERADGWERP